MTEARRAIEHTMANKASRRSALGADVRRELAATRTRSTLRPRTTEIALRRALDVGRTSGGTPRSELHSYGGPKVLQYEEAPRPQVQKGELLIRVHAAGVNSADWKVRAGDLKGFIRHKLPLIPGWDVSGIVEEVGPGPRAAGQFKKGDEVFAMADPTRDGAYADYIAIPGTALALKPKSLHHVRAAAATERPTYA
jgi:Alcohol dehydrogenase GroES-like domain